MTSLAKSIAALQRGVEAAIAKTSDQRIPLTAAGTTTGCSSDHSTLIATIQQTVREERTGTNAQFESLGVNLEALRASIAMLPVMFK